MAAWEDHDIDNEEAQAFVAEVLDGNHLEQPAQGIAKLCLDKGLSALSPKQRAVLKQQVFGTFARKACKRCSNEIPWSEQYNSYDNGGYCGYCHHMMEKAENE